MTIGINFDLMKIAVKKWWTNMNPAIKLADRWFSISNFIILKQKGK
jgi:hypothetical protein